MAKNRGKQFEEVLEECFKRVPNVSVTRIHDQTTHYLGSSNVCDYLIFHMPYLYAIECKSVHGNTLSIYSKPKKDKHGKLHGFYGNITDKQWTGLLEMSTVKGVFAGIVCWWVTKDVTMFIPIQMLETMRNDGAKSIRYDCDMYVDNNGNIHTTTELTGRKKRVFFEYDMVKFLQEMEQ